MALQTFSAVAIKHPPLCSFHCLALCAHHTACPVRPFGSLPFMHLAPCQLCITFPCHVCPMSLLLFVPIVCPALVPRTTLPVVPMKCSAHFAHKTPCPSCLSFPCPLCPQTPYPLFLSVTCPLCPLSDLPLCPSSNMPCVPFVPEAGEPGAWCPTLQQGTNAAPAACRHPS